MSQPPPPPAYGNPQQPRPQSSSDAVVALVLAILSWVVCPVVMAIVALVFASKAKKVVEASNGWVEGSGMITAAKIIAWLNIIGGVLGLVFFIIVMVVAAASTDTTTFTDTTDAVMALF